MKLRTENNLKKQVIFQKISDAASNCWKDLKSHNALVSVSRLLIHLFMTKLVIHKQT